MYGCAFADWRVFAVVVAAGVNCQLFANSDAIKREKIQKI